MIVPLRKKKPDGTLYTRPSSVEEAIQVLSRLPATEVARRAQINSDDDPEFIPPECILHIIRNRWFKDTEQAEHTLFAVLRQRVLWAVPAAVHRLPGSTKTVESARGSQIQALVLDRFQERLCADQQQYEERLDYYECRFNKALMRLRQTARRQVHREASRFEPLAYEAEASEPSKEVELALQAVRNPDGEQTIDFLYRSKLFAAISSLPPDERRVIAFIFKDVPIDSQDPAATTMVKILGCSEKTVRNRRDRAYAILRGALKEEEDS